MANHHRGKASERQALDAFVKLTRAADTMAAQVHRQLSAEGLTESQFGVLEVLYHLGPRHQCEIAAKLLKSGANMTTVLDNLERVGLIRRERDADDRRSMTIHLTAEGRQRIGELFPRHAAFIAGQMALLKSEEQHVLGTLCRKLGKGLADKITE